MEPQSRDRKGAQAVLNVVHSYAWSYDANDMECLSLIFEDDAITGGVVAGTDAGWGPWQGQEAIVAGLSDIRSQQVDRRRHQLTTPLFLSLTDEAAVVKVYLSILATPEGDRPRLITTGHYVATLRKSAGHWKLSRLDAELDGSF